MELDQKLNSLPLSRKNPEALQRLFGTNKISPFWMADMAFQVALPIQQALIERIAGSGLTYEYKPESFYEAQENWYRQQYGIQLKRSQVLTSPSITTSMALLLENFSDPQAGVIIQPPVFQEFKEVIRKTGRKLVKNPLQLVDQRYTMDLPQLAEVASRADNQVMIISNPHNPVGRAWTWDELKALVSICRKHQVLLISDEIHKDIVIFNHQFTSVLEFAEDYEDIIVLTSEAKTFNLAGISDSMAIVPSKSKYKALAVSLKKYNLGRTNPLLRVALEAAYTQGQEWLKALTQQTEKHVKTIERVLTGSPIGLIMPEATYQVWLDFRQLNADAKVLFERIYRESGVGLSAGHWFGREGAGFMRMNIATSKEEIATALNAVLETTGQTT